MVNTGSQGLSIPLKLALVVFLLAFLPSCILLNTPGGVADVNTPLLGRSYTVLSPAQDESCAYFIFGIPLGKQRTPQEIMDGLIQDQGGDAMIDITMRARGFTLLFMVPSFGQNCTIVEGKVVKF